MTREYLYLDKSFSNYQMNVLSHCFFMSIVLILKFVSRKVTDGSFFVLLFIDNDQGYNLTSIKYNSVSPSPLDVIGCTSTFMVCMILFSSSSRIASVMPSLNFLI